MLSDFFNPTSKDEGEVMKLENLMDNEEDYEEVNDNHKVIYSIQSENMPENKQLILD